MGCPDWPKCFGQWVPPTDQSSLPDDYKEHYSQIRAKKIDKFCKFLNGIGLSETAEQLKNDPLLLLEEDFNARKTWTEYVNRLFGFLAGNAMLLCFIWILRKYRKRKLVILSSINLVLMAIQAWFGSIVVASNLVPWTITVHMFLALVIIAIQIYIIRLISTSQSENLHFPKWMLALLWISFIITFYQMFLGTQVREAIDELTKAGLQRNSWIELLGMPFFIHRSFSWLVLVILSVIAWKNEKVGKFKSIRWLYGLLALELTSGVLLAYADMPGLVQTAHLVFASAIFGILAMLIYRGRLLA